MTIKKRITMGVILSIGFILSMLFLVLGFSNNVTLIKLVGILLSFIAGVSVLILVDENSSERWQKVSDWVSFLGTTILYIVFILTFVFYSSVVSGESMEPTLKNKQRIFVSTFAYNPKINDVVTIKAKDQKNKTVYLVKRVLAGEGDIITLEKDQSGYDVIYVNDEVLYSVSNEVYYLPFVGEDVPTDSDPSRLRRQVIKAGGKLVIEKGQSLVLGDNSKRSEDGRNFGIITNNNILGKVIGVK